VDKQFEYDAVIIGSGPNGLAAAIAIAQRGGSVLVLESRDTPGGGARTAELTLPGFHHDVCSAVHPTAMASPFFNSLPLADHGLEFIHPQVPLAHPLDAGECAAMQQSLEDTAAALGEDAAAYRRLFKPLLAKADALFEQLLAPPVRIPKTPFAMAGFGMKAMRSASGLATGYFKSDAARALFAGNAAHSFMPLGAPFTAAIGLVIMLSCHRYGWPVAKGGSGKITAALCSLLESLGGKIECGRTVDSINDLPNAKAYLFDTSPQALARIAGDRLPDRYTKALGRFRHGPGIFKIDYALSEAIPWTAGACRKAGSVHVGGTLKEIEVAERATWQQRQHQAPFILVAQQSLCDPSRAPEGKHTAWVYAHVPAGSEIDMSDAIEAQLERFAPGFRDCVLAKHTMNCADVEAYNANNIGGDIAGGANSWRQVFMRPVARLNPYSTPAGDIFIGSASTPPSGGVHGMCGYHAAQAALKRIERA
jgi:phytoene dehydrogenase-like protein